MLKRWFVIPVLLVALMLLVAACDDDDGDDDTVAPTPTLEQMDDAPGDDGMMMDVSTPTIWKLAGAPGGGSSGSCSVTMSRHHASRTFRFNSTPSGP